ncbi:MAG: EAL domain-containing protein, partial [Acidimicrobiales bacterium]
RDPAGAAVTLARKAFLFFHRTEIHTGADFRHGLHAFPPLPALLLGFGLVVLARIDGQDLDPAHTALVEAAATEIGQLCLREETGDRLARRTELSEVRARVAASLVDTRAGDLDRAVTDTLVIVGSALSASTVGWVPLSDRGALWVRDGIPVAHASAPDTAAGSIRAAIARRSDGAAFRFDTSDTGVDVMTGDAAALTVVPVVGRDEVVAAIVVTESGERPRPGVDLDLLTDIGGLIHQLDLRVAAESERDIRWRHDDLHARVMRRLLAPGIDDPSAVLDWAMAEIGRMLEADSVRFVDLDGDMVVPKGSWSSVPHPLIDRFEQPRARAECPLGEVALTDGSACVVRQGDLGDSSQEMLGELGVDDLIAIVVPIRGLGPAAALTVVALTGRPWGETEAKSMAELAAEIRQFLDGAQVRGDLQARLDLEDLHSLIAGALVSVDHHRADEVFDWVLSELVDQMGAAWACLLAIDDEAEAAVEVTRVWSPADPVELELEGLAERLRAVGASDETAVRLGPRGVAVAILSDGEVVGALCLAPRDDRALDPAELDILHSVGRLLHVARQRMAAELALSRRADLEDLIARAAAMLVEADDPEDIMAMVLGEIARFFGAVDVSWLVVDPELHQLRRAHVWPAAHGGPARSASAPFELGEEEWSWLWDSLRAPTVLAEHDIAPELRRRWGDHRGESLEGLPDQGCRSTTFICVPVFSGGRPTALLVVDTAAREGWSAASIRPLQALATVAREVFAKARVDRLFSTTFRSAPTGQLLLSDDGVIRAANESFSRLVGGDPVGRPLFELVEGAESSWWPSEGEFKLAVDHSVSWVRFRSAVAHVRGDADPLTIVHVEDVTADRRHRERLRFEATHDDLTGLGNRRLLMEALADQMESGGGAVLLIDVDRFKVVNDSLGHSAGDAVLVRIADRLRLSIRDVDEVCRFGGDEFAVLLRSVDEGHEIAATAHRLIEVIRRPVEVRGTTVMPTCSVGIARWSGDDDVESVIRHADAALYEAKGRGRDRYEFFDDARRQSLRERLALETSLRKGVLDRRFLPWYQPELDLETGEVVGFEALVRWDHPGRGLLPAGAFIEVAEEIGLAPEMSRLVLEESCAALRRWNDAGADVSVRVNIASAQLQTDELEHQIRDALERHRLRPHQLCLEITERSLMLDLSTSVGTLERIRSLGVKVAIDDFGTGFSSLAWLKGLPVDTLKIDRSFVSGLTSGRTDREIVRTIIWLARALGLDVVAEGVEEERELAILRGLGCRRAQGWLWSPAVPEEQVLEILASV